MGAIGRLVTTLAVVAAALAGAGVARAHGRYPETGQVAFHPGDPDVIAVRATFGIALSRDGGATWGWACPSSVGALADEDPTIAFTSDGNLLASLFDGLSRGEDGGCNWRFPSAELVDRVVIDLAHHPTLPATTFVVTSDLDRANDVFRSDDDGITWTATGGPADPILFETIRVAPSDPDRLYLSGAFQPTTTEPRRPFVYRSMDGGATWDAFPFADFRTGDRNVYLLGVDPTDANHLFLRIKSDGDDRVARSRDGGETWTLATAMPSVNGFAWSADGARLWVGGRGGAGLHRSDDGGDTFVQLRDDLAVGCLAVRGGELWACGDGFSGFALGRSADGGDTFEPVMSFDRITGMLACAAGDDVPRICAAGLPDLILDLGLPLDAGVPPGDASVPPWRDAGPAPDAGWDGGAAPDASRGAGGGGDCCAVAGPGRAGGAPPTLAGLALLLAAALRTRRRG